MSDKKSFGRGFAGKGYYIALILCAAAIGITGYLYYENQQSAEEMVVRETVDSVIVGTMATEADVPVIATQPPRETKPAPTAAASHSVQEKKLQVVSPLSGETLAEFAMETLSYNQTTRDWRVHNGMDIAAREGTAVAAAAEGTVEAACEDDTLGTMVQIRHTGGYTTCYASLQPELCVQPGDWVEAGQTIGYVGTTALVETALGSHLHFGVTCKGEPLNPAEFLALGD